MIRIWNWNRKLINFNLRENWMFYYVGLWIDNVFVFANIECSKNHSCLMRNICIYRRNLHHHSYRFLESLLKVSYKPALQDSLTLSMKGILCSTIKWNYVISSSTHTFVLIVFVYFVILNFMMTLFCHWYFMQLLRTVTHKERICTIFSREILCFVLRYVIIE